jgi:hypothetical protein
MKKILLHLLSVCFILSSCTAPIEIHTDDSPLVPVIYGVITDQNKKQYIRILSSAPYFEENKEQRTDDADVSVTDAEGNRYTFSYTENGYYESDQIFAAKEGMTYHLNVVWDFNKDGKTELYEAETTILPKTEADSVVLNPLVIMGFRHFSLNLYMQEPEETKNFYLCKFIVNDTISNNELDDLIVFDDRMLNGTYIDGITVVYFEDASDEKNIDKYEDKNNMNQYMIYPDDKVNLQVISIEEGYYNFINQCSGERNGENPFFGGPPSNITTNLSNGAVGYFTGYAIQELKVDTEENKIPTFKAL